MLATFFMPENKVYSAELLKPQLTHEVLEELMEHFLDPVSGSNAKGRKVLAVVCVHVDDLFITGNHYSLKPLHDVLQKDYSIGHQDNNDLEFTGQRVFCVFHENTRKKKCIRVDQKKPVDELAEVLIPKGMKVKLGGFLS